MSPEVKIKISALDNSQAAFRSVSKSIEGVEKNTQGLRSKMDAMQPAFQKMAAFGTIALGAVAVGANKAIDSATNLGESMNAVNVIFGDSAGKVLKFGETAAKSVGLSNAAFNQLATNTGTVLANTGKSMDEVADMTTELAVRAADLASVYNVEVDTAMNAIRSALIGQSEPLRNLGVVMSEAQTKAFALSTGIIEVDREMTEQEKTLARYNFIMAETTKQAGDFANTSDSLANKQRTLAASTEDLSAKLGKLLAPMKEMLFSYLEPLIARLTVWIEQNPELARNIVIVTAALAALVAVLGTVAIALLAVNPISVIIVGALTGLGFIIHSVRNAMKMFGISWSEVWEAVKNATITAIDAMLGPLDEIVSMVAKALAALAKLPGVSKGISITSKAFRSVDDLFRADGGPVSANTPYIVGERGPELFVPGRSGGIVPNEALGGGRRGGGGHTFVFNVQGDMTDRVKTDIMRELSRQMRLS